MAVLDSGEYVLGQVEMVDWALILCITTWYEYMSITKNSMNMMDEMYIIGHCDVNQTRVHIMSTVTSIPHPTNSHENDTSI